MDKRWHFGGPYGYEFDCQIIPPVGSGLSSRLESQAAVFLGQLESYRRASNLQSLTWYSQDSAGNFYEYGVIMGRPYAVIRVVGETIPPNPVVGRSGIVFYHEAIRSSVLYEQGIVSRDSNGVKPNLYVMVDAPWTGYGSLNKREFLGGAATPMDERAMFKPHAVAWSMDYLVHVVVQRQINNEDAMSSIFIGGFLVLQSDEVDFVGANLYRDALYFAYVDPSQRLVIESIPIGSIAYAMVFAYDPDKDVPKIDVPDSVGGEETICNFSPGVPKAAYLSAWQRTVSGEFLIDYAMGSFSGGTLTEDESLQNFVVRKSQTVTTSPHVTSFVRTAVYYIDAGESYQGLTADPPHRTTDDYAFTCSVPSTECRIDLTLFPVWIGFDEAGRKTVWRLNGYSSTTISGTISREKHVDREVTADETYAASVPSVVHSTEIDLRIYKVVDGEEALFSSHAVERTNWSGGQIEAENTIGDNFVTAHCAIAGDRFILVTLSGTDEVGARVSVPVSSAATTNSLGGSGTFNPNSDSSTSLTTWVPLILASSADGWPAYRYSVRKNNAYQSITRNGALMIEDKGDPNFDWSYVGKHALYEFDGTELAGMRDGLGPDPYTGGEAHGPITVTRTVTYTIETSPTISANARNNVFISNYCGRGCLYDFRLRKHVVSPWGIFSSDVINAAGGPTKNVYCVSGESVLDITQDFLTAAPDSDATAKMPIAPVGNVLVDDFFDPRGLL